jgi:hypothetical protein
MVSGGPCCTLYRKTRHVSEAHIWEHAFGLLFHYDNAVVSLSLPHWQNLIMWHMSRTHRGIIHLLFDASRCHACTCCMYGEQQARQDISTKTCDTHNTLGEVVEFDIHIDNKSCWCHRPAVELYKLTPCLHRHRRETKRDCLGCYRFV